MRGYIITSEIRITLQTEIGTREIAKINLVSINRRDDEPISQVDVVLEHWFSTKTISHGIPLVLKPKPD